MVAKDECCAGLHLELPGFYGHFNIAHGWGRGQKLGKRGPSVVIINIKNWSNHGQISNHNTLGKDTGETRERGGGLHRFLFVDVCQPDVEFWLSLYLFLSQKAGTNTYNMSMWEPLRICANISTKSFLLNETTSLENQSMGCYKLMQILIHLV